MKDNKLYTHEELAMFQEIENGDYTSMSDAEFAARKQQHTQAARNTIQAKSRKKSLNIRLYGEDIERVKAQAMREGLPYQTYLSSMIHKIATGQYRAV